MSETDPWFDQGASATLFGGRFRNFVVGRCRSQGLNLSADELDLIDFWFAGTPATTQARPGLPAAQPVTPAPQPQAAAPADQRGPSRWWPPGGQRAGEQTPEPATAGEAPDEDFPRIIRTRR